MKAIEKSQKRTRKINIFLVVFIILTSLLIGGYSFLKSKNSKADMLDKFAQNFSIENVIDDYDYDGLADWEEEIYKSSPTNPDTDGDGYLDGEEVASGFDPTKKGPNDKLPDKASQEIGAGTNRPVPGNISQMFAYIISNQLHEGQMPYINAQDPNAIDENIMNAIDEKVIDAIKKASTGFLSQFIPPFEKENHEFKLTEENNLEAIRNYAKETSIKIGALDFCQKFNNGATNETEAIQAVIETGNFEQINCFRESYLKAYQETLNVPVPLDWLDIHKELLSTYWNFYKIYQHIKDYQSDPYKGIIVMKKYEQTGDNFVELLKKISADIESREN